MSPPKCAFLLSCWTCSAYIEVSNPFICLHCHTTAVSNLKELKQLFLELHLRPLSRNEATRVPQNQSSWSQMLEDQDPQLNIPMVTSYMWIMWTNLLANTLQDCLVVSQLLPRGVRLFHLQRSKDFLGTPPKAPCHHMKAVLFYRVYSSINILLQRPHHMAAERTSLHYSNQPT